MKKLILLFFALQGIAFINAADYGSDSDSDVSMTEQDQLTLADVLNGIEYQDLMNLSRYEIGRMSRGVLQNTKVALDQVIAAMEARRDQHHLNFRNHGQIVVAEDRGVALKLKSKLDVLRSKQGFIKGLLENN